MTQLRYEHFFLYFSQKNVQPFIFRCWKCWYLRRLKSYDIKRKFMIISKVANLMHHPLCPTVQYVEFNYFFFCCCQLNEIENNFPWIYRSTQQKDPFRWTKSTKNNDKNYRSGPHQFTLLFFLPSEWTVVHGEIKVVNKQYCLFITFISPWTTIAVPIHFTDGRINCVLR